MMIDAPTPRFIPTIGRELRARQWAHLCLKCLTRIKPDVRQMAHLGWRLK